MCYEIKDLSHRIVGDSSDLPLSVSENGIQFVCGCSFLISVSFVMKLCSDLCLLFSLYFCIYCLFHYIALLLLRMK